MPPAALCAEAPRAVPSRARPAWLDARARRARRHLPPDCQLRRAEAAQRLPVMYFRPDAPAPSAFLRVAPPAAHPPRCVGPRAGIVGQALPLLAGGGPAWSAPARVQGWPGARCNQVPADVGLALHLVHAVFLVWGASW